MTIAGAKARITPLGRASEHAGMQHQRQHAGAGERRLASAAHAHDQHERRSALGLPAQLHQHAGHGGRTAEEDRRMLGTECFESPEWGTLVPRSGGQPAQLESSQDSLDDPRQVRFEQLLEIRRGLEGMKGPRERTALAVDEPLVDELVERHFLSDSLRGKPVIGRPRRRCGLAIDEKFRLAVPPEPVDRVLELEFRPGGIGAAVGPPNVSGQRGTDTRPEDDDCNVRFGRARHLFLKRCRRQQRLVLPEKGHKLQHVAELRFEPADDTARDKALFGHIAGGGYEDTERLERHSA